MKALVIVKYSASDLASAVASMDEANRDARRNQAADCIAEKLAEDSAARYEVARALASVTDSCEVNHASLGEGLMDYFSDELEGGEDVEGVVASFSGLPWPSDIVGLSEVNPYELTADLNSALLDGDTCRDNDSFFIYDGETYEYDIRKNIASRYGCDPEAVQLIDTDSEDSTD